MNEMKRFLMMLACTMLLVACSSAPPRYLADDRPIVNIDSAIASQTEVDATTKRVTLSNLSQQLLALQYQITWYDKDGVTQLNDWSAEPQWSKVLLQAKQKETVELEKPTETSTNYRVYIKGNN